MRVRLLGTFGGPPLCDLHYKSGNPGFRLSVGWRHNSPHTTTSCSQKWLREDDKEVRGWSDNNHVARETTLRSLRSRSGAIWLNLPEEQADLKD